jgi:hypothetical protein
LFRPISRFRQGPVFFTGERIVKHEQYDGQRSRICPTRCTDRPVSINPESASAFWRRGLYDKGFLLQSAL